jgi:hypothetical protein
MDQLAKHAFSMWSPHPGKKILGLNGQLPIDACKANHSSTNQALNGTSSHVPSCSIIHMCELAMFND